MWLIKPDEWASYYSELRGYHDRIATRTEYDMGYTDALDRVDDWMDGLPTVEAVVLPCKIGGKVFCILHSKNEVVEDVVEDYDIWSIKDGIKLRISLLKYKDYVVGEFGKTVFLTREEAEAALAERMADNV